MPEMKFSGKPYAGKLHVRFDEEGWLSNPYSTDLRERHIFMVSGVQVEHDDSLENTVLKR